MLPDGDPSPTPVSELNARRRQAVALRLEGRTIAEVAAATGLSPPTVTAAHRAWKQGGWEAVNVRPRGRKPAAERALSQAEEEAWLRRLSAPLPGLWSLRRACADLVQSHPTLEGLSHTQIEALASRLWQRAGLTPLDPWDAWRRVPSGAWARWREHELPGLRRLATEAGARLWALSERTLPGQPICQLAAHSGRGTVWWRLTSGWPTEDDWLAFWSALRQEADLPVWLLTHNRWLSRSERLGAWLGNHANGVTLILLPEQPPPWPTLSVPGCPP